MQWIHAAWYVCMHGTHNAASLSGNGAQGLGDGAARGEQGNVNALEAAGSNGASSEPA